MEMQILGGISLALILFVWVWIALTIVQRMELERKIEKLDHIENRLPEEERNLTHLKELRAIEQSKVRSAKWVLMLFGLLIIVALGLAVRSTWVQGIYGDHLGSFIALAMTVLTFIVLPTYFGLSLAGSTKKDPLDKRETVRQAKGGAA
jgi:hypothetical protein